MNFFFSTFGISSCFVLMQYRSGEDKLLEIDHNGHNNPRTLLMGEAWL